MPINKQQNKHNKPYPPCNQTTNSLILDIYDYMFYIVFDFMMAVIMFLFGMWFYKSEGKAAKFLSGYNMKSADERKKYDENAMCKAYGKRMMFMSIPFIAGMIIDIWHIGIGCLIAWAIWFVMFIQLLIDRHKRES